MTARTLVGLVVHLILCLWSTRAAPAAAPEQAQVHVDWGKVIGKSKTTATLQVVTSPLLRRSSPLHDAAFRALKELECENVRFASWYPFPRLSVAALEPPRNGRTSWDFSEIDPIVTDFFEATGGRRPVLSLSTTPQWMFVTPEPVPYPTDPGQISYGYLQGTELRDPTMREVVDYYQRVARWYTQGGFSDEYGHWHASPHHFELDYWEVLNEVDIEHRLSAELYTSLYDAIVAALRPVLPKTQFVGISHSFPGASPGFFEYFLNPRNHRPDVPLHAISYHFYAVPAADETPEVWPFTLFEQADRFLTTVRFIDAIRQRLSPATATHINEIGTAMPEDMIQMSQLDYRGPAVPESYWSLSAALFAYLYGELSKLGVEVAGMSHLMGYRGFFPNCTMLEWRSGQPNVRYWTLKLLREHFGPGDCLVATSVSIPYVYAQGFVGTDGRRKLLLVNKRSRPFYVGLPKAVGGQVQAVSPPNGSQPRVSAQLLENGLKLPAFAVAVVSYPTP
jgi:hypothetical protein